MILDQDGVDEILVSVGDHVIDLETLVYRLSNNKEEPYILAGRVGGQQKIYFDDKDNIIIAPYGTQGLFDSYEYKNKKIKYLQEEFK